MGLRREEGGGRRKEEGGRREERGGRREEGGEKMQFITTSARNVFVNIVQMFKSNIIVTF